MKAINAHSISNNKEQDVSRGRILNDNSRFGYNKLNKLEKVKSLKKANNSNSSGKIKNESTKYNDKTKSDFSENINITGAINKNTNYTYLKIMDNNTTDQFKISNYGNQTEKNKHTTNRFSVDSRTKSDFDFNSTLKNTAISTKHVKGNSVGGPGSQGNIFLFMFSFTSII